MDSGAAEKLVREQFGRSVVASGAARARTAVGLAGAGEVGGIHWFCAGGMYIR